MQEALVAQSVVFIHVHILTDVADINGKTCYESPVRNIYANIDCVINLVFNDISLTMKISSFSFHFHLEANVYLESLLLRASITLLSMSLDLSL